MIKNWDKDKSEIRYGQNFFLVARKGAKTAKPPGVAALPIGIRQEPRRKEHVGFNPNELFKLQFSNAGNMGARK